MKKNTPNLRDLRVEFGAPLTADQFRALRKQNPSVQVMNAKEEQKPEENPKMNEELESYFEAMMAAIPKGYKDQYEPLILKARRFARRFHMDAGTVSEYIVDQMAQKVLETLHSVMWDIPNDYKFEQTLRSNIESIEVWIRKTMESRGFMFADRGGPLAQNA